GEVDMFHQSVIPALVFALLLVAPTTSSQTAIEQFNDRSSFTGASRNVTVIDFEGIAPSSGFTNYKAPNALAVKGLQFQLGGGESWTWRCKRRWRLVLRGANL